MIPLLPSPLPQKPARPTVAEGEHEAELRRVRRRLIFRRSRLRAVVALVVNGYFTAVVVLYPNGWTLGAFALSMGTTAWTVRDVLRARRELMSAAVTPGAIGSSTKR
jgi:hypothetical protein